VRILHAIHDFLPRHRAGSEIHAARLCQALADRGHQVHVLCAELDPSLPHGHLTWRRHGDLPVTELVNNWRFDDFAATYADAAIERRLEHVLEAVQPDVLHIHSLLNLSLSLPALARRRGIAVVALLHDWTLVCPSGGQRVHVAEAHVCHVIDSDRCARCFVQSPFQEQMAAVRVAGGLLGRAPIAAAAKTVRRLAPRLAAGAIRSVARRSVESVDAAAIDARLAAARAALMHVDRIVAPSRALADGMIELGAPRARVSVSDYGFPPLALETSVPSSGRVRVGLIGTLVWHKGLHLLLEAARRLPRDRFDLHVHGELDTFPEYGARVRELARDLPVTFHGRFDAADIGRVYGSLEVVVVPSLWPENSPLVVHEAFQAGIPIVASELGGLAELVRNECGGVTFAPTTSRALAEALEPLIVSEARRRALAASAPPVKSLAQDASEWEEVYRAVTAGAAHV